MTGSFFLDKDWKVHELAVKFSLSYPLSFQQAKGKIEKEFTKLINNGTSIDEAYKSIEEKIRNGDLLDENRGEIVG